MLQCKSRAILNIAATLSLLLACRASALEAPQRFYVDFASGSDEASGKTPAQAWRHAPGDPSAKGRAASHTLQPGDTVIFRGGIAYRGSISVNQSGQEGRPIVYLGEGFGNGKAVLDGRDRVRALARPCGNEPACSTLPNAAALSIVELPNRISASDQLALNGRPLILAQAPAQPEPFWFDDLANFEKADREQLTSEPNGVSWRLASSFLKQSLGTAPVHDLIVHVWRMPNAITSARAIEYDAATSTVRLNAPKLAPYPNKPTQFALANHPALIRGPDQFATIADGARIIVSGRHSGAVDLDISRRKDAFQISGQSHIVISGFEITGYAAGDQDFGRGAALLISSKGANEVTFKNNYIHDISSWAGAAAVHANNVHGLRIENNRFNRIFRGGGVIIGGGSSNVGIYNNIFEYIGRTGVALLGVAGAKIDGNRITEAKSVHGNGISIYLNNTDVFVTNNFVDETPRALTFQGGPSANNLSILNNVLIGNGRDGSAIQSWGKRARNITIQGNVLFVTNEGRSAVRLNASDENVSVRNNLMDGILVSGSLPDKLSVANNVYTKDNVGGKKSPITQFDSQNTYSRSFDKARAAILNHRPIAEARLCALLTAETPPRALPASRGPWQTAPIETLCAH